MAGSCQAAVLAAPCQGSGY